MSFIKQNLNETLDHCHFDVLIIQINQKKLMKVRNYTRLNVPLIIFH